MPETDAKKRRRVRQPRGLVRVGALLEWLEGSRVTRRLVTVLGEAVSYRSSKDFPLWPWRVLRLRDAEGERDYVRVVPGVLRVAGGPDLLPVTTPGGLLLEVDLTSVQWVVLTARWEVEITATGAEVDEELVVIPPAVRTSLADPVVVVRSLPPERERPEVGVQYLGTEGPIFVSTTSGRWEQALALVVGGQLYQLPTEDDPTGYPAVRVMDLAPKYIALPDP